MEELRERAVALLAGVGDAPLADDVRGAIRVLDEATKFLVHAQLVDGSALRVVDLDLDRVESRLAQVEAAQGPNERSRVPRRKGDR